MTSAVRAQEASSSTPPRCTYHVFLSFRGEDTRKTFADNLYRALNRRGFHTFKDDDEIKKGENIEFELQRAIQQSRISIIVFSKDYASSRWCLDELVKILERKKTSGHEVLPVFYDIDPSDVRNQTGNFKEPFLRHEGRFKAEAIEEWRAALREIANLGGMDLKNHDGYESAFVEEIATVVEKKLKLTILSNTSKPVGLCSRARDVNLWLQDGSNDVSMLLITGISGIGKTTIARYAYNINFKRFEGSSFLANVREISEQSDGLVRLQRQLLSDISNYKQEIHSVDEGKSKIKLALCCKRVLIVLDDVDQRDQIEAVLELQDWLYLGSKILITTRHVQLLKGFGAHIVHEVKCLDYHDSLELFSWHAFRQAHPLEAYVEHTKRALEHCGGLPLALELLGSNLFGESVDVWINTLKKLDAIPNHQIFQKMRISYDLLPDDFDKNLFLHIACFFVGEDENFVITVLDGCGLHPTIGILNLVRRCMLKIIDNKVSMHQLLQEMGREIVRLESPGEPEKRSRLWHQNDSFPVLREKLGTENIEGLALDMNMSKEEKYDRKIIGVNKTNSIRMCSFGFCQASVDTPYEDSNGVALETNAFTRMRKLKILQLSHVELKGHYKEFPKGLKWLKWHGFPLKHMPNEFPLESLVALDMRYSNLRKVWNGAKILGLLKILNLSHSHSLVRTPDFDALPNLERLVMKDCASLTEIHESIGNLKGLVFMNVKKCIKLRKLPKGIGMLKSLQTLIISGCSNLAQLPKEMKNMESLKVFLADRTALDLKAWALKPRKSLERSGLPCSLVTLSLAYCNLSDDAFPRDFSSLPSLLNLNLSRNPISKLPDCIRGFPNLRELSFESCTKLQSLFGLPSVAGLDIGGCTSLERVTFAPQASCLQALLFDNDSLLEIEGEFKLEPIGRVDADIINNLGISNLESMANTEMNFYPLGVLYFTRFMRLPMQGLFEYGVFSTFIPGGEVPKGWLSGSSRSFRGRTTPTFSSLSFTVPSCTSIPSDRRRIRCLNVCCVYAIADPGYFFFQAELDIFIINKTKDLEWGYRPRCCPISVGEEQSMWLSQWKIGNLFRLEVGDEVDVTFAALGYFQVKECGINLVYEENEEEKETLQQLDSAHPNCQGVCFVGDSRSGSYQPRMTRGCFDSLVAYIWAGGLLRVEKELPGEFTLTAEEAIEEFKALEARRRSRPAASMEGLSLVMRRRKILFKVYHISM